MSMNDIPWHSPCSDPKTLPTICTGLGRAVLFSAQKTPQTTDPHYCPAVPFPGTGCSAKAPAVHLPEGAAREERASGLPRSV